MVIALAGAACAERSDTAVAPGVPWSLASDRATLVSDIRYDLALSIPSSRDEPIRGRVEIRFTLARVPRSLVLDFAQDESHVSSVTVNGDEAAYDVRDEHIVMSGRALQAGANLVGLTFVAGDGSLNRQDEFLYTLFVPDRARVAFPCFDQPNLKGRFALRLEVPAGWEAVATGEVTDHDVAGDRATYTFAETPPLSTYLFAFAAGIFQIETWERRGRRLRMYHRETDAAKVARNRADIFELHARAIDWLEEYTGIPYPFEKFDFVLIPSFQFGGMEHPGAILYRASSLLLDETATQNELLGRASVIAHETSHMWFGDLVTMEWFDDVWMKEVFANFMAAKVVNPSFPEIDHELRFLLAHYPAAYAVDRTEGANPIRQPLENLNEAGTLYGAIIYQKAPVVMRHLERLIGENAFRDGLREYLSQNRFGNATWLDLIDVLDRRTAENLTEWSRVWVEEAGRPTITTDVQTADDAVRSVVVRQSDPARRGRVWNQRLELLFGYVREPARRYPVYLNGPAVSVSGVAGLPAPDFVLPNGDGLGYGGVVLDARSLDHLLSHLPAVRAPLVRGVAWITLWEAVLTGRMAPASFVGLALDALVTETDELNTEQMLDYLTEAYWRYLTAGERNAWAPSFETLLWELTKDAERTTLKAAYFAAYRRLVLTVDGTQRLRRVWNGRETIPGLTLSERDFMTIALALAVRDVAEADQVLAIQLARIDNPDRRERFEFVRPAASPDPATRERFFDSLREPANRRRESWVIEALSYLHHPLRAVSSERFIRPSLELLEEIQRTGDIFFPKRWLDVTLSGHSSPNAAAVVRAFLAERPDLPPRLRQKLLQSADPLFRAAALTAAAERELTSGARRQGVVGRDPGVRRLTAWAPRSADAPSIVAAAHRSLH